MVIIINIILTLLGVFVIFGLISMIFEEYYKRKFPKHIRIYQPSLEKFIVQKKNSFVLGWENMDVFNIGIHKFEFKDNYSSAEEADKAIKNFIEFYKLYKDNKDGGSIKEYNTREIC